MSCSYTQTIDCGCGAVNVIKFTLGIILAVFLATSLGFIISGTIAPNLALLILGVAMLGLFVFGIGFISIIIFCKDSNVTTTTV